MSDYGDDGYVPTGLVAAWSNQKFSYGAEGGYEGNELEYEPEEPEEEFPPGADVDEAALEERAAADGNDERTVVTGDPNQSQQKPTSDSDKKIPDDKRSTTPYMTKYERARVLGTRALQIRYGSRTRKRCKTAPYNFQHECTCLGRPRGRDRPLANCNQGAEPEEDPSDRAEVFAWWMVGQISDEGRHLDLTNARYEDWTCEELL
jgi:RNA polymerase Rpb6